MKALLLKLVYFSIPVLLLAASVFALNSATLLKRPFGAHDDVQAKLQALSSLAAAGRWEQAGPAAAELRTAWQSVRRRVQFVTGTSETEFISMSLADVQGAVAGRDLAQFRVAERRLQTLWESLGH